MAGVSISFLRDRLQALRGVPVDDLELSELLTQIIESGAGVTIDVDGTRFRIIRRDNAFTLKAVDARPSTIPPPRRR